MSWPIGLLVMVEAILVLGSTCFGFLMGNSVVPGAGFAILAVVCLLVCLVQFLGDRADSI